MLCPSSERLYCWGVSSESRISSGRSDSGLLNDSPFKSVSESRERNLSPARSARSRDSEMLRRTSPSVSMLCVLVTLTALRKALRPPAHVWAKIQLTLITQAEFVHTLWWATLAQSTQISLQDQCSSSRQVKLVALAHTCCAYSLACRKHKFKL